MSRSKKISFTLAALVIFLLILEAGLQLTSLILSIGKPTDPRLALPQFRGKEWSGKLYQEMQESSRMKYDPFLGWRRPPYNGEWVNIDAVGVRRTWNPDFYRTEPQNVFVFGGSTIWGSGARDEHTIPSEMSRLLNEKDARYRITNQGEGGYTFQQEVLKLVLLLRQGERPDYVVFYDGINDVAAAYEAGEPGAPSNLPIMRNQLEVGNWGKIRAGLTGILKEYCATCRVMAGVGRRFAPNSFRQYQIAGMDYSGEELRELGDGIVGSYRTSLVWLDQLARTYGFRYAAFWQPVIFTEERRVGEEEGIGKFDPRAEDEKIGELYRYANGRLVTDTSAGFYNISDSLKTRVGEVYIDNAHISEEGNRLVAERIVGLLKSRKW